MLIAGSNEREFVKQLGQLHEQIAIALKGNLICRYFCFLIASNTGFKSNQVRVQEVTK